MFRKHYLDVHRTGSSIQIAAVAAGQAAAREGERMELVLGHAVTVFGDAPASAIARFAADTEQRVLAMAAAERPPVALLA